MKKKIFIIIGIIFLGGAFYIENFYWKNLRGIGPIISKPPIDIVNSLNNSNTASPSPSAPSNADIQETPKNTTEMPLKLPPGFSISLYAKNLGKPRVMHFGPDGKLLVSIPSQGKVVRLIDKDNDGFAETHADLISGLNKPHGIALRSQENKPDNIYIAETDQVAMYDYDTTAGKAINKKKIFDLPGGGNHFSRTIMFMPYPDHDRLLTSIGSSCNVCNETDSRRAKILVSNFDGSNLKEYAKGLRNSVFMAIHPVTGKIWATEMGRDLLGDDIPPDEINIIEKNKNYGWPICFGKNIHDTKFDTNTYFRNPCMEPFETPSYIDIPAHSAPLGLAFFPEEGWPKDYWHNLLVAYHGSWNRNEPTGYKIVRYKLDEKGNFVGVGSTGSPQAEDFITGWLKNGKALGRPVDIIIQPGGTIFVSDDFAGVIYKITYNQKI